MSNNFLDGSEDIDRSRRFGGIRRLYGDTAFKQLENAHVCIIGIGGVGSWAAEALARSAVGKITLIDLDMVAESNVNRQIHALTGVFGQAKTSAMAKRIRAINPACQIHEIEDFITQDNLNTVLDKGFDCVIDAIDQVRMKAAVIAWCLNRRISIITAGGAGGQTDPTRILITDLSRTIQDPLLSKVRARLRKEYGFPRGAKKKFGVRAVFSTEPVKHPDNSTACENTPTLNGLHCAGYGSSVCVTASFGFFAAAEALRQLATTTSRVSSHTPSP